MLMVTPAEVAASFADLGDHDLHARIHADRRPCADLYPDVYSTAQPPTASQAERDMLAAGSRALCAGCPVKPECLALAMRMPDAGYGTWGGTAEWERRRPNRPVDLLVELVTS